jgi:hypothetical protein
MDLGDQDHMRGAMPAMALEQFRRGVKQEREQQVFWFGPDRRRSRAWRAIGAIHPGV